MIKTAKNNDWETASFAALMFSLRKFKDRLTETHHVKLNSRNREIDVRIIDQSARQDCIDNAIAYFFERHNRLKGENDMSQALEELMEDRITARVKEGRKEERDDLLSRLQSSGMLTAEQIATVQNWRF